MAYIGWNEMLYGRLLVCITYNFCNIYSYNRKLQVNKKRNAKIFNMSGFV